MVTSEAEELQSRTEEHDFTLDPVRKIVRMDAGLETEIWLLFGQSGEVVGRLTCDGMRAGAYWYSDV